MISGHDWFAEASAWWWPRMADHLWQATLFATVVLLASFLLRRSPARLRHTLWLLASAKFVLPATILAPFASAIGFDSSWLLSRLASGTDIMMRGFAAPVTSLANDYELTVTAISGSHNELYCGLTAIWLMGCAMILMSWLFGRSKCGRALNQSRRVTTGREWLALQRAKDLLSLRSNVQLRLSPIRVEPGVFNIWKPVVLLPDSIADHLDDQELLAIMLHELVHVQRRDNLTGRLLLALTGLFWFHPFVWFISRRLFDEREQACDERVLEIYGPPETYAASILKVVRFSFGWNVAGVTGVGSGSNLRRRIDNIMALANGKRSAGIAIRLVAGAVLGIALVAIVIASTHTSNNATAATLKFDHHAVSSVLKSTATPSLSQKTKESQDQLTPPAQPPSPPQPANPPQEEAPANPAQPPTPPTPEGSAAPAQPVNPPQPPNPEAPPTPPAKSAFSQEKSRDEQYGTKKGKLIEAPRPVYPDEAREKKVEGEVTVEIVIGEEGNVISASPRSGPELLQGAAKDAALKARFEPTLVKGKPAKVVGSMTYNFVLDEN